jgi:hypothetical protein
MRRKRTAPIYTAALCVHITTEQRVLVEQYADENRLSLGEAGRNLLEAGAKALGLLERNKGG